MFAVAAVREGKYLFLNKQTQRRHQHCSNSGAVRMEKKKHWSRINSTGFSLPLNLCFIIGDVSEVTGECILGTVYALWLKDIRLRWFGNNGCIANNVGNHFHIPHCVFHNLRGNVKSIRQRVLRSMMSSFPWLVKHNSCVFPRESVNALFFPYCSYSPWIKSKCK